MMWAKVMRCVIEYVKRFDRITFWTRKIYSFSQNSFLTCISHTLDRASFAQGRSNLISARTRRGTRS